MSIVGLVLYALIAVAIGAVYYFAVAEKEQRYLLIFLIYVCTSILISQIYLSANVVSITETGTMSGFSWSPVVFFFLNLFIFIGVRAYGVIKRSVFAQREPRWLSPTPDQERPGLAVVGSVLAIELLNVFISHPNGFSGDRIVRAIFFERIAVMGFLPDFFGVLAFFIPIVCAAIVFGSEKRVWRIVAGVFVALYFVYMKGIGQVFHGMLLPASVIGSIYLCLRRHKLAKINIPVVPAVIIFALVTIPLVIADFGNRGVSAIYGGAEGGAEYRLFVLQGSASLRIYQLWASGLSMNFSDMLQGRDFWILHTMPHTMASAFLDNGVNLQGALSGTFLLFGGLSGSAVLCLLYGFALGAANDAVLAALKRGSILALFPASYLWIWMFGMYSRASFEEVAKPKLLITLVIYFAILYLLRGRQSSGLRIRPPARLSLFGAAPAPSDRRSSGRHGPG